MYSIRHSKLNIGGDIMASIKKLKSGWQYRVSYKDKDGRYKTKSGNGFSTKKEAQLAASEIEARYSKGYSLKEGEKLFNETGLKFTGKESYHKTMTVIFVGLLILVRDIFLIQN